MMEQHLSNNLNTRLKHFFLMRNMQKKTLRKSVSFVQLTTIKKNVLCSVQLRISCDTVHEKKNANSFHFLFPLVFGCAKFKFAILFLILTKKYM